MTTITRASDVAKDFQEDGESVLVDPLVNTFLAASMQLVSGWYEYQGRRVAK